MAQRTNIYTNNDKFVWLITGGYFVSIFHNFGLTNSALMMIFALLFLVSTNYHFELKPFHLFILQFCLFCYATAFWAMGYAYAIDKGNTIFFIWIVMSIFYCYYQKLPKCGTDILFTITLYSMYIVILYSVFFIGVGRLASMDEESGRLIGGFNANTMGMLASSAILINFYYFMEKKHRKMMFMAIPAIYLIAASQSRKAIFMLVAGVLLLYFIRNMRGKKDNLIPVLRFFFFLGIVITIFFFLSKASMFTGTMNRLEGFIASITGEGDVDSSTSKREFMREIGWIQFSRTPLLGIGMGCARILSMKAMDSDGYLHCNYAELAADGGLIGLISYYSIYLYVLFKEIKYFKLDKMSALIITLVIVRLITDWGMVSYYNKETYFLLMIYFLHISYCKRLYLHPR